LRRENGRHQPHVVRGKSAIGIEGDQIHVGGDVGEQFIELQAAGPIEWTAWRHSVHNVNVQRKRRSRLKARPVVFTDRPVAVRAGIPYGVGILDLHTEAVFLLQRQQAVRIDPVPLGDGGVAEGINECESGPQVGLLRLASRQNFHELLR
jgi:hypothetical protein